MKKKNRLKKKTKYKNSEFTDEMQINTNIKCSSSPAIQEMQIKTVTYYYFSSVRLLKFVTCDNLQIENTLEKGHFLTLWELKL